MDQQLHWGIIGTMEKARMFAADLPYAAENHLVQAVLTDETIDAETAASGLHIYTDLQEFLQSDIEAVYIASPQDMHYARVKQCLLHHKPVLCEKPIAQDAEELDHLMKLSENSNTFMMEALWVRFLPTVKKILNIIGSGAIGDIISIKASVHYKNAPEQDDDRDVLIDLGIYPVFLCVMFIGRPDFIEGTRKKPDSAHDFFSAFLSYDDGQYGLIEASTINKGTSYAIIEGDKGSIQIKNPWSYKPEGIEVDYYNGTKAVYKSEWEGMGYQFEVDEVYQCLKEGMTESQLYPQHFILDVMQTMDDMRIKLA